jgi:cyanophycinase-like exopeptidase
LRSDRQNSITVVDAGAITYTNLPELERNDNLTLHNLVIHVLSAGHSFDLKKRAPIEKELNAKQGKAAKANKAGSNEN